MIQYPKINSILEFILECLHQQNKYFIKGINVVM